jgi:hypothetical protein
MKLAVENRITWTLLNSIISLNVIDKNKIMMIIIKRKGKAIPVTVLGGP